MLFDPFPPPLRDSLYAAVGLPVVLAEEAGRAARQVTAHLDRRLGHLLVRLPAPFAPLDDLSIRGREAAESARLRLRALVSA